ncbi:glycosyltransferase family 2 protein [Hydrogenophaga sp. XSHU_21]
MTLAAPIGHRFTPVDESADVFVVLVSYNTHGLLHRCIDHLRAASSGLRVSVVFVDNASRDGSAELIKREFPDCAVIENTSNVGFGRANNQALAMCNAPFVLLLNTDAYMARDALSRSLHHMRERSRCGVLGLRLVDESGEGDGSAREFPDPWRSFSLRTGLIKSKPSDRARGRGSDVVDCDWVTGCYYFVRRQVIDEVGLFDPRYFLYFEEVDHCRAVHQAGWQVQCLLSTTVIHVGGASARSERGLNSEGTQLLGLQVESELLYFRKHSGLAGLCVTVLLGLATDAVLCAKDVLRGRGRRHLGGHWRHAATLCRLTVATRGGTRSTR